MDNLGVKSPLKRRQSGVLLHPSSLPGPRNLSGNFGAEARRFVDFLAASGFGLWQVLPLGPTDSKGSPYRSSSAFAGNADFISLENITAFDLENSHQQQYEPPPTLEASYQLFLQKQGPRQATYKTFVDTNHHWLEDYALYRSIQQMYPGLSWNHWPQDLRNRKPAALQSIRTQSETFDFILYEQFVCHHQWQDLRAYAQSKDISLMGDLPLFVAYNSADVWSHQNLFNLDDTGLPLSVAGVPPDYFSKTGQRWDNPQYNWELMAEDNFLWWRQRIGHLHRQFDLIRIDHFRGLEAYWDIPATCITALEGHWVKAPGQALLDALMDEIPNLRLVAEDLGIITPEVEQLRDSYCLPGMKILQFAFDSDDSNPYLPHNLVENSVIYTGTHDNDTSLGWFNSLNEYDKHRVLSYLGTPNEAMPWPLITSALASVALLAIIPMQDLLALGSDYRMNTPGTCDRNWRFRLQSAQLTSKLSDKLLQINKQCHRYDK